MLAAPLLLLPLLAFPARAAECWKESAPAVVFTNDQYGTLKEYLLRAREGLRRSTPTLEGFGSLSPAQAARVPAALRSQGLAFDGGAAIFSWRYGLQRADLQWRPIVTRPLAIPRDIQAAHYDPAKGDGFGHIGDVDVAGGRLYAPIEDEDHHTRPFVAVFDARTLRYTGEKHELPVERLPHGVPWLAVDAKAGVFYTMDWDSPDLLVFDLKSYAFKKAVRLSPPLKRVQGGKVRGGRLYVSSDEPLRKRVCAIDPATGAVTELAHFDEPERAEMEGLAFGPDGTLHVLILAPYSYDERFPEDLELNGDDWNPSARLVHLRPGSCP